MRTENDLKFYPLKRRQRETCRRLAEPRLAGRVADIGAGWGPYHAELSQARIVALDYTPTPAVQVVGSALALPFRDGGFRGALMTETLEHVAEPAQALAEAARILAPGGWLYVTVPQMWPLHYEPHDYYRYTRHGLEHLVARAGLQVAALEPVAGLYTFLLTRGGEKIVKLGVGLLGWLPRARRWQAAWVLLGPWQYALYWLGRIMDRWAPRDVAGWACLAQKPQAGC